MDTEAAINFLVAHAAKIDADLAGIKSGMATKQGVSALAGQIREGTKAMRQYTNYVESMLNIVTRGHLTLEEQVAAMRAQLESMQDRIAEIERRNPPQAA